MKNFKGLFLVLLSVVSAAAFAGNDEKPCSKYLKPVPKYYPVIDELNKDDALTSIIDALYGDIDELYIGNEEVRAALEGMTAKDRQDYFLRHIQKERDAFSAELKRRLPPLQ